MSSKTMPTMEQIEQEDMPTMEELRYESLSERVQAPPPAIPRTYREARDLLAQQLYESGFPIAEALRIANASAVRVSRRDAIRGLTIRKH